MDSQTDNQWKLEAYRDIAGLGVKCLGFWVKLLALSKTWVKEWKDPIEGFNA